MPMDVLIVEDDPVQRRLLRGQLTRLGYNVREVANGELAWNLLQQQPCPIVITDWMMPSLDGPGLITRIREGNLSTYTYLIMLTSRDDRSDIVAGLDAGADDYITKPCDVNELRARVAIGARIVGLETQLREMRDTDELTGLRNRRAITALAETELARAAREMRPLSVVMLDIDHFKQVNDTYGHQAGDQALCLVAGTVSKNVRLYDVVGRWGGEEILLLLPGTTYSQALMVAERVRAAIAAIPLGLQEGQSVALTASLGVASRAPGDVTNLETLVASADMALYHAKSNGRNCVCGAGSEEHTGATFG